MGPTLFALRSILLGYTHNTNEASLFGGQPSVGAYYLPTFLKYPISSIPLYLPNLCNTNEASLSGGQSSFGVHLPTFSKTPPSYNSNLSVLYWW